MPRPRRGATLVELLVALLLLDLALLSLAAMGAAAAKRVGDAARRSRAIATASNRVEGLAGRACPAIASGRVQVERGVVETWSSRPVAGGVELHDSIAIGSRPPEHVVVRRRVPCA